MTCENSSCRFGKSLDQFNSTTQFAFIHINIALCCAEVFVSGQHLNQSCINTSISQLSDKLTTPAVAAGAIYAGQLIKPFEQVHYGLSGEASTLGAELESRNLLPPLLRSLSD